MDTVIVFHFNRTKMMIFVAISSLSNVKKRKIDEGLSHTKLREENGGI